MRRLVAFGTAMLFTLGIAGAPATADELYYIPGYMMALSKTSFFSDDETCAKAADGSGKFGSTYMDGVKRGYWRIEAWPAQVTAGSAEGVMTACGKLHPTVRRATGGGLGASCETHKGYDGKGTLRNRDDSIVHIHHLGWHATAGDSLVAVGRAWWDKGDGAGRETGDIVVTLSGYVPRSLTCGGKNEPGFHEKRKERDPHQTHVYGQHGTVSIITDPVISTLVPQYGDMPGSPEGSQDNPVFCTDADANRCPVYGPKMQ